MNSNNEYVERTYRERVTPEGLTCFNIVERESDLYICAESDLRIRARELLLEARGAVESYIEKNPLFEKSLVPVDPIGRPPGIILEMIEAGKLFNVGPMAAVAGAVAQYVGSGLMNLSPRLMVENGGDIFLAGEGPYRAAVFAGEEFPSIDIVVESKKEGIGICTSSATIGPSLSFGAADAVTVVSRTAAIADAAATAFANAVRSAEDVDVVIQNAANDPEILGIVVAIEDRVGIWGGLQLG